MDCHKHILKARDIIKRSFSGLDSFNTMYASSIRVSFHERFKQRLDWNDQQKPFKWLFVMFSVLTFWHINFLEFKNTHFKWRCPIPVNRYTDFPTLKWKITFQINYLKLYYLFDDEKTDLIKIYTRYEFSNKKEEKELYGIVLLLVNYN